MHCPDALRCNPAQSAAISQLLVGLAWLAAYPADCGHDALRPRATPAGDEVLCPLNAVSPVVLEPQVRAPVLAYGRGCSGVFVPSWRMLCVLWWHAMGLASWPTVSRPAQDQPSTVPVECRSRALGAGHLSCCELHSQRPSRCSLHPGLSRGGGTCVADLLCAGLRDGAPRCCKACER